MVIPVQPLLIGVDVSKAKHLVASLPAPFYRSLVDFLTRRRSTRIDPMLTTENLYDYQHREQDGV